MQLNWPGYPVNIKILFYPQKTDAYVSAGLSSGYIYHEAYTSVYGYSAGASTQTTDNVTRKSLTAFIYAKHFNRVPRCLAYQWVRATV